VRLLATALAVACVAFAGANVLLESSGTLADRLPAYAGAFTVMNVVVIALKIVGAAVALLTLRQVRPGPARGLLTVAVWAAFATLAFYALGAVVEFVAMVTGVIAGADGITPRSVAYLLGFAAAAAGFGVLAMSWSRRAGATRGPVLVGLLGGPVVIGAVLVLVPAILRAVGVMPAS